ncbi:MAG TPA: benzoate/H(+) symporter BenE family transporter [Geminicoccaceae bacterium]|nr:benzoate/H(+) symporter BenE family transporter [Geminicoccus sp.]HMU49752.1 benzoate/H(+) symporter BenE family transporter [Geminicoccaceae bacterium]
MRQVPPAQAVTAGLLTALVGSASSFAVVLQGLDAVGADPAQAASGLMALFVAMGLCGVLLSWRYRMPISIAWSTPGAALLVSAGAPEGGFAVAVGAFLVAGLLVIAAAAFRPLGRLIAAIPTSIASAMLAGVLLPLCLAPVRAVAAMPVAGLAIVLAWLLVGRWERLLAVPAAAVVAMVFIVLGMSAGALSGSLLPAPSLVVPAFSPAGLVGIALPLFLVTMASQNIPGLAVLSVNGYRPEPGPLFIATGLFSLAAAPFGGHAVNLSAITAALCAGPDAGPDPQRRWWAAAVAGAGYVVLGLAAGAVTALAGVSPLLVQAVAGLALIGAFSGSIAGALADPAERDAAAVTFVVTASGLALAGISAAFWGLLAGSAVLLLGRWRG